MRCLLAAGLIAGLFSTPTHADFSGDYAIELWTVVENGGTARTSNVAAILTGSNSGLAGANQDLIFTAFENATITFDWIFSSADQGFAGIMPAQRDPFGYLKDGTFFQVTDNAGPNAQSGTTSFEVLVGEVFGFRAHTIDGLGGPARARVANFTAAPLAAAVVPLPPAAWLFLCAIGGLMFVRRRSPGLRFTTA
jgi:hypothetical protein